SSLAVAPSAVADTTVPAERLLYRGRSYGSESLYSPLSVLLNKGFDHMQARNARRDVWTFPYGTTARGMLWDAVRHPRGAIERHPGWNRWLRTEVLPATANTQDAAWVVNYTEHLLAGGLTYRMLDAWYARHGAPAPRLRAAATTLAAAALNEMAEFPGAPTAAASTVADLWVFDLGGIALFSLDPLVRWFGGTLQAANWSTQATFTSDGALRNNGQYLVYKVPLPRAHWRLFLRGGMGVQAGLTRALADGYAVTLAAGGDTEIRLVDPVTRAESIRLRPGGGVYVDRHHSLLASLTAGPAVQRVTLNVYPGVLPGRWRDVGVWGAITHDGRPVWGLVHRRLLGVGVGYAPRS
ncbi:MAG: hypothetical protein P3C09_13945, partial [Gemmatimonadota bacterium]|nr:hypothetical protein [Gemmatimonadota bacterium]